MSTATSKITLEGKFDVCCHTILFWYDLGDLDLTSELEEVLTEEAESRAKICIIDGCHAGELNCLWQDEDETEIRGWFQIERA